jgi:transcription antitermination factor NusG
MNQARVYVYVAVTEPGCEKRAMRWLIENDMAAFVPMRRFWRYAAGRRHPHERPMPGFERYVFVASDLAPRAVLGAVSACRYVSGMLGVGDDPTPIDAPVMGCEIGVGSHCADAIERLSWYIVCQAFGMFDATLGRKPAMTVGQLVRIIGGQFGPLGYVGPISERRGDRLIVSPRTGGKVNVSVDQVEIAA